MARPKANTPEGRKAIEKWRKTMVEKYGEEGVSEMFRQIGSLGGRAKGFPKGFALDRNRAVESGRKGGKISRRTGIATGQGKKKEYVKVDERFLKPTGFAVKPEPEPEPELKLKKSFIKRMFGGK